MSHARLPIEAVTGSTPIDVLETHTTIQEDRSPVFSLGRAANGDMIALPVDMTSAHGSVSVPLGELTMTLLLAGARPEDRLVINGAAMFDMPDSEREPEAQEESPIILWGGRTIIDRSAREVLVDDQPVHLTPRGFELFTYLGEHPRVALHRNRIYRDVWNMEPFEVSVRTIDIHIRRLRRYLGPELAANIETIRSIGYKLVP